jgi:hypothetical protein
MRRSCWPRPLRSSRAAGAGGKTASPLGFLCVVEHAPAPVGGVSPTTVVSSLVVVDEHDDVGAVTGVLDVPEPA